MKKKKIDISVVVPARNEEAFLADTLKSIRKQDFKGNYEIIVVDNGSSDKTAEIAQGFKARVIKELHHGIANARDKGFRAARGKIVASTDADTIVPQNWLSAIAKSLDDNPQAVGISGKIVFYGSKTVKTGFVNLLARLANRIVVWMTSDRGFFRGANFAVYKDVFLKAGGFNREIVCGEDQELGLRVAKLGKIIYKRDLIVATSARRYQSSRINDLIRFYIINFFSLHFAGRPYVIKFDEIRSGHDARVSSRGLKIISMVIGAVILLIIITAGGVYSAFNPKSQLMGKTYWHKKTHQKIIALTFDDGPNEPYTSQVLEILDKYGIKATFFEVGKNVERESEVTKKLFNDGQIIGNHSYSHPEDLSLMDDKALAKQVDKTNSIIDSAIGRTPKLFRPPYGIKSPFLLDYIKDKNMMVIEWSDMTKDYNNLPPNEITKYIFKKAKPGGIIVLHDGDTTKQEADRSRTVEALPTIIEKLKSQGYYFVTIPELLNIQVYQ